MHKISNNYNSKYNKQNNKINKFRIKMKIQNYNLIQKNRIWLRQDRNNNKLFLNNKNKYYNQKMK